MNWHICHKRKLLFLFVFSTYLHVFLLKFQAGELVGCGIKFCIQRALPLEIWVKKQTYMSKIRAKKVVLFYDKYVSSTIMVDSFYWNYIGSWIPTHRILLLARFLIRPILDPKFPLMRINKDGFSVQCYNCYLHDLNPSRSK